MNHSDSTRRSQARYPGVYKRGGYSIVYRGVTGEQIWETAGPNEREAARIRQQRVKAIKAERAAGLARTETPANQEINLRRIRMLAPTRSVPRLGNKPLAALRPSDFDGLVADLETGGRLPGTIRNVMVPVRSMLSDAVRLGVLASNPAARVDMPAPPSSGGQEIPTEHLAAIREALTELSPADPLRHGTQDLLTALAFDLTVAAGLRWSELIALRWRSCNFDARSILIDEAIVLSETKSP